MLESTISTLILLIKHVSIIIPTPRSLDYISIMTYDLNGAWNSYTGHNSPLYPRSGQTGGDEFLNMVRDLIIPKTCFQRSSKHNPLNLLMSPPK